MNEIITNGTEIKQRILIEINKANSSIFMAMAWFTDRDIANAIIEAKKKDLIVDIILSSNVQNETVKEMLKNANVSVHAFATGDSRGIMHHKFCLIDHTISIHGSYNYSYNASNNNVENIQVTDDSETYRQLYSEFERLKYNIDHNIDVNSTATSPSANTIHAIKPLNIIDEFSQQLENLVYTSVDINMEDYRKKGFEKSKENAGSISVFQAEYNAIKEKIRVYATDEGLNSTRNRLTSSISRAFESKKLELEDARNNEIESKKRDSELDKKHLIEKSHSLEKEKSLLQSGNEATGEKGILQINKEIETHRLDLRETERGFIVEKFWSIGSILTITGLVLFAFYLSMFFGSAMYKMFFEGNLIRNMMETGITPPIPPLVDANAIIKIFKTQGFLFGLFAVFFFIIPVFLSNIKHLGSKKKWVNILCFWTGLLIFDVIVSTMLAMNTDEIKKLLVGQESTMKVWEAPGQGEFWLIFVFGMLPLIITHFLLDKLTETYKKSRKNIVDSEKHQKVLELEKDILELNSIKEVLSSKIRDKEIELKGYQEAIMRIEKELNNALSQIEIRFSDLLKLIKSVYDDFESRIASGRIFTTFIFETVISAFKSGFIEHLASFYAEIEVSNRVREIDKVINQTN
jgi:hypothetical protein